jgi:hypothetical protein
VLNILTLCEIVPFYTFIRFAHFILLVGVIYTAQ